jgi:hypothetical protein
MFVDLGLFEEVGIVDHISGTCVVETMLFVDVVLAFDVGLEVTFVEAIYLLF